MQAVGCSYRPLCRGAHCRAPNGNPSVLGVQGAIAAVRPCESECAPGAPPISGAPLTGGVENRETDVGGWPRHDRSCEAAEMPRRGYSPKGAFRRTPHVLCTPRRGGQERSVQAKSTTCCAVVQKKREQVMGIEPTWPAWEAGVLPLNYTCTARTVYHPGAQNASPFLGKFPTPKGCGSPSRRGRGAVFTPPCASGRRAVCRRTR